MSYMMKDAKKSVKPIYKTFDIKNLYGSIRNTFVLNELPFLVDDVQYYDINSTFPISGPFIQSKKKEYLSDLMNEYQREFRKFCLENNIISEVIIFDPVKANAADFVAVYEVEMLGAAYGTSLLAPNPIKSNFSQYAQHTIKNGLESNIEIDIVEGYQAFEELNNSLEKSKESFQLQWLIDLLINENEVSELKLIACKVRKNQEVIGVSFYLADSMTLYKVFDSWNLCLSTNKLFFSMQGKLTKWAKNKGYSNIYLGSNMIITEYTDILNMAHFNRKENYQRLYGKKIWNEEIFKKACQKAKVGFDGDYFPAYRRKDAIIT